MKYHPIYQLEIACKSWLDGGPPREFFYFSFVPTEQALYEAVGVAYRDAYAEQSDPPSTSDQYKLKRLQHCSQIARALSSAPMLSVGSPPMEVTCAGTIIATLSLRKIGDIFGENA